MGSSWEWWGVARSCSRVCWGVARSGGGVVGSGGGVVGSGESSREWGE